MEGFILKILSGPQTGAEVMLAEGEYTLGSAAEDDLQFNDLSLKPAHARLRVTRGAVEIRAGSGSITSGNGLDLEADDPQWREVEQLDILCAGMTRFAIGAATANWTSLPDTIRDGAGPLLGTVAQKTEARRGFALGRFGNVSARRIAGAAGLAIALFVGLWLLVGTEGGARLDLRPDPAAEYAAVREAVEGLAFPHTIEVRQEADGAIFVNGYVETLAERRAVVNAINETGVQAGLRVGVLEVLRNGYEGLMQAAGYDLEYELTDRGILTIRGTVLERDEAERLAALVSEQIIGLSEVRSEIRTAEDLFAEVSELAERARISDTVLLRLDGLLIEASGIIGADKIDAWAGFVASYVRNYADLIAMRSYVQLADAGDGGSPVYVAPTDESGQAYGVEAGDGSRFYGPSEKTGRPEDPPPAEADRPAIGEGLVDADPAVARRPEEHAVLDGAAAANRYWRDDEDRSASMHPAKGRGTVEPAPPSGRGRSHASRGRGAPGVLPGVVERDGPAMGEPARADDEYRGAPGDDRREYDSAGRDRGTPAHGGWRGDDRREYDSAGRDTGTPADGGWRGEDRREHDSAGRDTGTPALQGVAAAEGAFRGLPEEGAIGTADRPAHGGWPGDDRREHDSAGRDTGTPALQGVAAAKEVFRGSPEEGAVAMPAPEHAGRRGARRTPSIGIGSGKELSAAEPLDIERVASTEHAARVLFAGSPVLGGPGRAQIGERNREMDFWRTRPVDGSDRRRREVAAARPAEPARAQRDRLPREDGARLVPVRLDGGAAGGQSPEPMEIGDTEIAAWLSTGDRAKGSSVPACGPRGRTIGQANRRAASPGSPDDTLHGESERAVREIELTVLTRRLVAAWRQGALASDAEAAGEIGEIGAAIGLIARFRTEAGFLAALDGGGPESAVGLRDPFASIDSCPVAPVQCWPGSGLDTGNLPSVLFWLDLMAISDLPSLHKFHPGNQALILEAGLNPKRVAACAANLPGGETAGSSIYILDSVENPGIVNAVAGRLDRFAINISGANLSGKRYIQMPNGDKLREGAAPGADSRLLHIGELGTYFRTGRGLAITVYDPKMTWRFGG